jgi:hypothetical protein
VLEGSALDALVMDSRDLARRPTLRMFRHPITGQLYIDQGSLHGIGRRSIVEVFPPAGLTNSDEIVGHVEVARVSALLSEVKPVAYAGKAPPEPEELGAGNRCRVAVLSLDLPPLRVAVREDAVAAPLKPPDGKGAAETFRAIVQGIAAQRSNLIEVVTAEQAEWALVHDGTRITLRSLAQTGQGARRLLVADVSRPATQGADAIREATQSALTRVARARQLMHLSSPSADAGSGLDVKVELVRYASETAKYGTVVTPGRTGRVLHHGDVVSFRITNPNKFPVDVSLLFVDSQYGITCLFPERGAIDDNRLPPSRTIEIPRIGVSDSTTGPEQVIAIAVRSSLEHQDFRCLEQDSLERLRGTGGMNSPLGRLLQTTIYGEGETRGLSRTALSAYRVTTLPWLTEP